jgi:hypothetical protein
MNTQRMSEFLAQVSAAHQHEYIIMVVDGASSHVAKNLVRISDERDRPFRHRDRRIRERDRSFR